LPRMALATSLEQDRALLAVPCFCRSHFNPGLDELQSRRVESQGLEPSVQRKARGGGAPPDGGNGLRQPSHRLVLEKELNLVFPIRTSTLRGREAPPGLNPDLVHGSRRECLAHRSQ
jgi:hypothetical protein